MMKLRSNRTGGMPASLINKIMIGGNKAVARRILDRAMAHIRRQTSMRPPAEIFRVALERIRPRIEVRARRIGDAVFRVPSMVTEKRSYSLGLRELVDRVRSGRGRPASVRLAEVILSIYDYGSEKPPFRA